MEQHVQKNIRLKYYGESLIHKQIYLQKNYNITFQGEKYGRPQVNSEMKKENRS